MNDTHPKINKILKARYAALTGEQRMIMGAEMHTAAQEMVYASIPESLPQSERRQIYFKRFYEKDFTPKELTKILAQL